MKLTAHMRTALEEAQRQPLRRPHDPDAPGAPPWPAPAVTLHALVRLGLLTIDELRNRRDWRVTTWTITDAGRKALEPLAPRVYRHRTRLLATHGARPDFETLPSGRQVAVERDEGHETLHDHGYTSHPWHALRGEPEAIDPTEITRWHEQGRTLHAAERRRADDHALAEVTPEARLRALRAMALERRIDIRDDLRVLDEIEAKKQRRIDAIERKVRREAA